MKRTPLQRKMPMKRSGKPLARSRLKPASKSRSAENRKYSALRIGFLNEHPFCQAKYPEICTLISRHVHHKAGRGKNLNAVETWMALCPQCHDEIHQHPKQARLLGYLAK